MASLTSDCIDSISAGVALRLAEPITCCRMLPSPTNIARFGEKRAASAFAKNGSSGTGELPSLPSTTVVMPWNR